MREVEITLKKKPPKHKVLPGRRKGLPKKKESRPNYHRRAHKGGVTFYDLQLHKVGASYLDVDYSQDLTFFPGNYTPDFNDLSLWEDYRAAIYAIEPLVANWETKFKKLDFTGAEKYGITVYDVDNAKSYPVGRNGSFFDPFTGLPIVDTKWAAGGLAIPEISNFQIRSSGGLAALGNSSSYKITQTLDYSAAAVTDFVLKPDAKVFFISDLGLMQGFSSDAGPTNIEDVYSPRVPFRRDVFLDMTDSNWSYPALTNFDHSVAESSTQSALRAYTIGFPGSVSRVGSFVGSASPGTPSDFNLYSNNAFIYIGGFLTSSTPGGFIGVVKQDSLVYYFWQNDTGVTSSPGSVTFTI